MPRYRSIPAIEFIVRDLDQRYTPDKGNPYSDALDRIRDILAMPDEPEPDTRYNGWTNYATWLINLEILSDYCDSLESDRQTFPSVYELADHLKTYTEEIVSGEMTGETGNELAISYALSFVSDVNYDEIADHYPELIESDDDDDDDTDDEGDA